MGIKRRLGDRVVSWHSLASIPITERKTKRMYIENGRERVLGNKGKEEVGYRKIKSKGEIKTKTSRHRTNEAGQGPFLQLCFQLLRAFILKTQGWNSSSLLLGRKLASIEGGGTGHLQR